MRTSDRPRYNAWLELLGLLLVPAGFFFVLTMLLVLGIGIYVWLAEPHRLAVRFNADTQAVTLIDPQPRRVSPGDSDIVLAVPTARAYENGAATMAAVWVNGKSYSSGGRAAWDMLLASWQIWLLGTGALVLGLRLNRAGDTSKPKVREDVTEVVLPEPQTRPLPRDEAAISAPPPSAG